MKNNFKYIIALALVIGSCLPSIQAQTNDSSSKSGAQFGIKGGVNFSNLYTENVEDNNVLTSFNVGVFTTLPLSEFIAIQPELLYTGKGAELVYNNAFCRR
jgi:ABC-type oligopeptide transport system substrate-binding subunit